MKKVLLKVSYPGIDVSTASPKDCTLHSDYTNFKSRITTPAHFDVVSHTFLTNPSDPSSTNIITIPHGYSYTPACICYGYCTVAPQFWSVDTYSPLPHSLSIGGFSPQTFNAFADETNFYVTFDVIAGGFPQDMTLTNWVFKYYIFAEAGVA